MIRRRPDRSLPLVAPVIRPYYTARQRADLDRLARHVGNLRPGTVTIAAYDRARDRVIAGDPVDDVIRGLTR